MTPGISITAGAVAALGASLLFLSACVRLRAGRSAAGAFAGSLVAMIVAVVSFNQWLGLPESVYTALVVMMLLLSLLPFITALVQKARND